MLLQPPWEPQADEATGYLSYNWNVCLSCHAAILKTAESTSEWQWTSGVLIG